MYLAIGIFSALIVVKDSKMSRRLKKCPHCGSTDEIREILYGLPSEEPDPTKYVTGGCLIGDDDPVWACVECGWQIPQSDE